MPSWSNKGSWITVQDKKLTTFHPKVLSFDNLAPQKVLNSRTSQKNKEAKK